MITHIFTQNMFLTFAILFKKNFSNKLKLVQYYFRQKILLINTNNKIIRKIYLVYYFNHYSIIFYLDQYFKANKLNIIILQHLNF